MLLERAEVLDRLAGLRAAGGAFVWLTGEAGLGKTSVLRALEGPTWWGRCDPLSTPRPLGPLLDLADGPVPSLAPLLESHRVFGELLQRLREERPLLVLEDLHWADEGTLDLVRFLVRRLASVPALVVATLRDDEPSPALAVLGESLRESGVSRIGLAPLSAAAVGTLAQGSALDPDRLHAVSGGNPFFVSEVLASGDLASATVRDAVLARVAPLPEGVRAVLEQVAAEPGGLEVQLADGPVDAAVASGVLLEEEGWLRFRHELARAAVASATLPGRRRELHAGLLATLAGSADRSRLAHHAIGTGDPALVLEHVPPAADEAARRGARREEAALLAALLTHHPDVRQQLRLAGALALLDRPGEGLPHATAAVGAARRAGDVPALGLALVASARCRWLLGEVHLAREEYDEAVAVLRPGGDTPELAEALVQQARHAMLARHHAPAVALSSEARAVAERLGDAERQRMAAMILGTTELVTGDPDRGVAVLTALLDEARAAGDAGLAALVLSQLGTGSGEQRRYADAERYLREGIEEARRADHDYSVAYNTAWLGRIAFEQGRWTEATDVVGAVRLVGGASYVAPLTALTVLGRVRVRRGDPDATRPLREALELGRHAELQHRWSAYCGLAEDAWLRGRPDEARALLAVPLEEAQACDSAWARGELGYWARSPLPGAAVPFAAEPAEAAVLWRALGCPYEEALALAEGDPEAQLRALELFDGLGARPAGLWLRARMREEGVGSVPRGPRAATREHPHGLTDREAEVHALLVEGLTNAEIAQRLFISPKTVERHVSAVLAKVGVASRRDLGVPRG